MPWKQLIMTTYQPSSSSTRRAVLRIRPAQLADLPLLVDFNGKLAYETERLSLDPAVLKAGVANVLTNPTTATYFVAELDGTVVGSAMITHEWSDWRNGDIWWIQSVYVVPAARRSGVFTVIYAYLRKSARAAGAIGLRLYVETNNVTAQRAYAALGMTTAHYAVMEDIPL